MALLEVFSIVWHDYEDFVAYPVAVTVSWEAAEQAILDHLGKMHDDPDTIPKVKLLRDWAATESGTWHFCCAAEHYSYTIKQLFLTT